MCRRPAVALLIAAGLIVFLVTSALLTRVLSVDGAERTAVTELVQAEARGDGAAMMTRLQRCRQTPACRARVTVDALNLDRPGKVVILELNTSAGFSLGSTVGTARVAWRAGSALPVVQCVRVRRAGNALTGLHVELIRISLRIRSDTACPARY